MSGRAAQQRAERLPLCAGKVAFDSFDLAKKAAGRHRRNGTRRIAYRCRGCRRWHLCGPQGISRKERA